MTVLLSICFLLLQVWKLENASHPCQNGNIRLQEDSLERQANKGKESFGYHEMQPNNCTMTSTDPREIVLLKQEGPLCFLEIEESFKIFL